MIIDKDNIKILLFILVLGLGIGYAYINSDLNINGTAQVNSANWDVHWANVQVDSGSVSASSPTISNQTTVIYSVTLNNPGDFYEFTVDAVNGGSIDAMIDIIDSKLNGATITTLPAYLKYSVTYADGVELEPNHQLLHNTTETYKVRIEYNTDIESNQLPATNQTLNLQFTVTYRQANENSTAKPLYVYTINNYPVLTIIGSSIPNNVTQYTSYSDALAANSLPFFLKHKIENNVITESYVGFLLNNKVYYIKGGDSGLSYTSNVDIIYNAFNFKNCHYDLDEDTNGCYTTDNLWMVTSLVAVTSSTGYACVTGSSSSCSVQTNGSSCCGYE